MTRLAILLVLVGCSAAPTPAPALACSAESIVSTPNGDRLIVSCNQDVPALPDKCEIVADRFYRCNVLHADAEQCAAFPGICK